MTNPYYEIQYVCPECGESWTEFYESACDSECHNCGLTDIEPVSFGELQEN